MHRVSAYLYNKLITFSQQIWKWCRSRTWKFWVPAGTGLVAYLFCLPSPLFTTPVSFVVEDREGHLLGARIAEDGQWRFPVIEKVPDKFAAAVITFEDKRFYYHPGVDPIGFGRALWLNLKHRKVVSGGSTLTMQVIRLANKNPKRSIWNKLIELIQATRLELGHRKKSILALYASHAPFGGNVVGLEAASWRYFGKSPDLLNWAEAATLAVLPNAPAAIHPGKARETLLKKRNKLLTRLQEAGYFDPLTLSLSLEEPLPDRPHRLPQKAPHLLEYARKMGKDQESHRIKLTLDPELQEQVNQMVLRHAERMLGDEVHNMGVMVVEVGTGRIVAYTGNVPGCGPTHAEAVDVNRAPRSTGSVLKPLLYARALQEGLILPKTLLPDIPTVYDGYRPENSSRTFDGAVPASEAVSRSLNVPMVNLLKDYGIDKFHFDLNKMGFTTMTRPPGHYGLSLIVGGAECTLWDLVKVYRGMAATMAEYYTQNGKYNRNAWSPLVYHQEQIIPEPDWQQSPVQFGAGAAWFAAGAMNEVVRPEEEGEWQRFSSNGNIAWKTGTSHGNRDAWAVGLNARYVVGVWVGNADGEGRPGLTGIHSAAPLLFDVFGALKKGAWFVTPWNDLNKVGVCAHSGERALPGCGPDSSWIPVNGLRSRACQFHQPIHVNHQGQRVRAGCTSPFEMNATHWFVLPPAQEFYYRQKHPEYAPLPPWAPGCEAIQQTVALEAMQLIYPRAGARITIPVDITGKPGSVTFQAAHRDPSKAIHWHIDEVYWTSTRQIHQLSVNTSPGLHQLTLVDETGYRISIPFTVLDNGR